jgi:hypothetical protein
MSFRKEEDQARGALCYLLKISFRLNEPTLVIQGVRSMGELFPSQYV